VLKGFHLVLRIIDYKMSRTFIIKRQGRFISFKHLALKKCQENVFFVKKLNNL